LRSIQGATIDKTYSIHLLFQDAFFLLGLVG